ncbi:MAG: phosphodiesterase [Alphaproteobacteria bacterium]
MTTLLQLSDTHIAPEGQLVAGRLETGAPLAQLVARLQDVKSQLGSIDAVLVTGDLSEDGSAESYERFKRLLDPLDLPLFVIPGNHDARQPLLSAFRQDGYLSDGEKLNWHQQIGAVHVIGLDTLIEGQGAGELDGATLQFLEAALAVAGSEPVMIAMHHPPFPSGIAFMDEIGLKSAKELAAILHGHRGEVRVVCGHVHSMMIASIGPCVAISAPSPCSSFAFDIRTDARVGFFDQGDGCLVHRWTGHFQTVRIGPNAGSGPFPF